MKQQRPRGYSLIEISSVIVVIAILATIVMASYNGAQLRARNTKVQDGASKIADAIQLFIVNKGHFPIGGWGSTQPIGTGTECIDGENGWFGAGMYTCTIEDTLVASDYLPAGFTEDLPPNTAQSASNGLTSVAVYRISADHAMVFYSVENASEATTEHFNNELQKCGINPSGTVYQRDSLYLQDGICFEYHL